MKSGKTRIEINYESYVIAEAWNMAAEGMWMLKNVLWEADAEVESRKSEE